MARGLGHRDHHAQVIVVGRVALRKRLDPQNLFLNGYWDDQLAP